MILLVTTSSIGVILLIALVIFGPFCLLKLKKIDELPTTDKITSLFAVSIATITEKTSPPSFGIINENSPFATDGGRRRTLSTFACRRGREVLESQYQGTGARPKCLQPPSRDAESPPLASGGNDIELGERHVAAFPARSHVDLARPLKRSTKSEFKVKVKSAMSKLSVSNSTKKSKV